MIVYEGKSMLDGMPIVMIALPDSTNRKTGNLIQTYIMRSDIHPQDAINSGQDESICGSCIHRKQVGDNGRTCYVFPPSFAGIWKSINQAVTSILILDQSISLKIVYYD